MLALVTTIAQAADPLPSWNDGKAKQSIMDFVKRTTTPGGKDFVPEPERIATFDNDGTLWAEQPLYFQLAFALDRVKALAPQHPEWKGKAPFASLLKGDLKSALAGGEPAIFQIVMATHAGMTTEEFEKTVTDWIATAKHPKTKRPYTEMVYQPMLELLAYLRANGFKTFIVSGGGIDFMRPWTEKVYGIPPEKVIGSSGKLTFELRGGKPVLVKLPELNFIDDKAGKPVGIQQHIGRRPILAFGNSDGDLQMLQWTAAGSGARLLRPRHSPHRRRARVGVRPQVLDRPPRQGARRGQGQRLDGSGHEGRLEDYFPDRARPMRPKPTIRLRCTCPQSSEKNPTRTKSRGGNMFESASIYHWTRMLGAVALVFTLAALAVPGAHAQQKPNILLIVSDDTGYGDPGPYGGGAGRGMPTPNLDRLADEGMTFFSFYAQPSCTPGRAALLTGRIPNRSGMTTVAFQGQGGGLPAAEWTLGSVLKKADYQTFFTGKWHLGEADTPCPSPRATTR